MDIFLLATLLAALFVCLKTANATSTCTEPTYTLYATLDSIGGLEARSPVSIGGAIVGRVAGITLDPRAYLSRVALEVEQRRNHIPDISLSNIRTPDPLGEQYLALDSGLEDPKLGVAIPKGSDTIQDIESAIMLEDLIGQSLYGSKDDDNKNSGDAPAIAPGNSGTTEPTGIAK